MILAHGLGGRTDLPLPVWLFSYGAAFTLLISFMVLAVFWPKSRLEGGTSEHTLERTGPTIRGLAVVARFSGLAAFAVILTAAAIGDNSSSTNLAPVAVYVLFWVGLLFVSGFVGDVWQVLSPFDTLAALPHRGGPGTSSGDVAGDAAADEAPAGDAPEGHEPEDPPDGGYVDHGYWPAAAGLLAFVWVELVYPDRARPRDLFVLLAAYTVVMLACAARWGRGWLRRGEAFAALFGILAHIAPLHRTEDGRLQLRPPFAGLATLEWRPGLEAVVLVALGSTSFDGLSRTQLWIDLTGDLGTPATVLAGTAGLLWAVGAVATAYILAMRVAAHLVDGQMGPEELRASFVHSLVPIVLAYAIAHYFSLLLLEGQTSIALISDPFGRGWDLFGTAGRTVNYNLVTPATVAYVQCAAIVIGHVAGVVLAHDRALALFDKRSASRSQYPLLVAMVVFTVGGLFLLLGG